MSDPLDDLFHTLRSPASPAELEGMAMAVDAMHHALLTDSEPSMTPAASTPSSPTRSRRMQVATLVAAGVLGFAGVAAAGPGGFLTEDEPTPPASTTAPSTTAPETTVPETTLPATTVPPTTAAPTTVAEAAPALVDDEVLEDDPDTEFDETLCAEGNHGQTVSSVAHEVEPGPGHGDAVRDAAHSSCGKDDDVDDDDADDDDDETSTTIDDDDDDDEADDDDAADVDDDDDADDESGSDQHGNSGNGNSGHGNSGNSGHGNSGSDDD